MTIHSKADLHALQYLDDPDIIPDSLSRYLFNRIMFRKFKVGLPSSIALHQSKDRLVLVI